MIYIHENGKRRSRVKRIRKEYIEGTQLLMRIHTYINKCCVNCLISDSFSLFPSSFQKFQGKFSDYYQIRSVTYLTKVWGDIVQRYFWITLVSRITRLLQFVITYKVGHTVKEKNLIPHCGLLIRPSPSHHFPFYIFFFFFLLPKCRQRRILRSTLKI